jgi:hypothetical protein
MEQATLLEQAKRIKDPVVRSQVIANAIKQGTTKYGVKIAYFSLSPLFSWADTPEKGEFWKQLDILYGQVNLGESNEYIAAYPINDESSDCVKTPKITDDIWIHCSTEEEANTLLRKFHEAGLKWAEGQSYLNYNLWYKYGVNTVYNPRLGAYGEYQAKDKTKIYPASLFIISVSKVVTHIPKITDDIWIHCSTEEEANSLLRKFHEAGLKWSTGENYIDNQGYVRSCWSNYKKDTVYNPFQGVYGIISIAIKNYPASLFINQSNQSFINNSIPKTYGEHTDSGTAAYIRPENGKIAVGKRRTGNAICYRGCKVITRTGHPPNGSPAYGI